MQALGRWHRLPMTLGLVGAVMTAACAPPGSGTLNSASPNPTDPPIAGAVTLTPDQFILPAEQFPLSGYDVTADKAVGTSGWSRTWTTTGGLPFYWVKVDVKVLKPSLTSNDAIAKTTCDWTFTPPMLKAAEVTAPVVGDGAKACAYDSANSPASSLVYTTGTRNTLVTVSANRLSASQSAATGFLASLADYQLWIIDNVAPRPGLAARPAPEFQIPGAASRAPPATAQPTQASGGTTPTATAVVTAVPTPVAVPVALSLVLNSLQCGTRVPNQYEPKGYLVQGFVANMTATGPVGAFILDVNAGSLTVLDWTGSNPRERLKADPSATRLIAHYALGWSGDMNWTPITLEPPNVVGPFLQQSFHLSC